MIPVMQARFLHCMKKLYPKGVDNKHQHRDLIKVFVMGWIESRHAIGESAAEDIDIEIAKQLTDFNWCPGRSWEWWR